ncbi:GNAT family N-acetyltransferase [Bacillus pseudomycoides]|uniref:GNAT family N-acetyltransferase n=1 Tax=Bacillus pseudomycoides TaxID=64104 RepID=UPI000BEC690A|nr:GNAT family N-acetyltransferase [Bacillus pseudomycoides]PEB39276.1 GNAT family N-acetyltransferase [Bacillus pseudomycoides]PGD96282.1 GNAT family N-acetyltransferase [Bacillus pseudomycoides]PGE05370.1 GNAT family N-acetyltransferase [Bacillus pseudomycoides]PHE71831.1 GNAT family N-acetyltransferase [Bacillus pseudomycoides]PHG16809.1 GNAT family N-acetyltransferase [Bacillus pseudomycoides]
MQIQKKKRLTIPEIQHIIDLAHICKRNDGIDYPVDLHVNILKNRKENRLNDFLFYNNEQLIGVLNMYEFERPTKLELTGFVDPHFRKQKVGTTLLQTAMEEIQQRDVDEVLLIINGASTSGKEFAEQANLPYLYSEYGMEFQLDTQQTTIQKHTIELIPVSTATFLTLLEISSKAFGDSLTNTSSWLQKIMSSPTHQVYISLIHKQPIGTITVNKQNGFTSLSGFAVHPSYQGKGYGKSILQYIVHQLLTEGRTKIELEVETKNDNALKLYKQCGFEITTRYDYYDLLN